MSGKSFGKRGVVLAFAVALGAVFLVGAAVFLMNRGNSAAIQAGDSEKFSASSGAQSAFTPPATALATPPSPPKESPRITGEGKFTPPPLLVPLKEGAPVSHFEFGDIVAAVGVGKDATSLSGTPGSGMRVPLQANVTVPVRVRLPATEAGGLVRVTAPNGGKIERRNGRLEFRADGRPVDLDLAFTPTLGNGAYTVMVSHGGDRLTYEFWVGPRAPQGQPGSVYVPPPPAVLAAEMAALAPASPSAE